MNTDFWAGIFALICTNPNANFFADVGFRQETQLRIRPVLILCAGKPENQYASAEGTTYHGLHRLH
jgi:hypothetical protein